MTTYTYGPRKIDPKVAAEKARRGAAAIEREEKRRARAKLFRWVGFGIALCLLAAWWAK